MYLDRLILAYKQDTTIAICLLLRALLGAPYYMLERTPKLKESLGNVLNRLLDMVWESNHVTSCIHIMLAVDDVLKKNPWATKQNNIDKVLMVLGNITSAESPEFVDSASDIFELVCDTLGTILSVHRKKIGGRYHQVVEILNNLQRCLFEPYEESTILHPKWLKLTQLNEMTEKQGEALARVISTICDPTVFAVRRARDNDRSEVNDETKKVRSIAGQNMQAVIIEFSDLALRGKIQPQIRDALNEGLYVIFDVFTQEIRKSVSDSLDSNRKAIFHSLYDDYKKFGKWNGT